jgi:MFS family permease
LGACQFWLTSFVLYLNTRGFDAEYAYFLLGLYSIAIVIFEYPTGVIGDFFSHKISLSLGFGLLTLSLILISFAGSVYYYGFILILSALGSSLISGSDTALLHTASINFKADLSHVKFYSLLMSVTAITIGGFLSAMDLRYPLYASALSFFVAGAILSFAPNYRSERIAGNIFATSAEGFRHVVTNKELLALIKASSLLGAFFISLKWFYNPLFLELKIPLNYWGVIIAVAGLLIAGGVWIFKKFPEKNIVIIFIAVTISIFFIGSTNIVALPILAIFINQALRGYIDTQLDIKIHHAIQKSVRASVMSLKSLLVRLGSSFMIFLFGIILAKSSFFILMSAFAIGIFVLGIHPILKIRSYKEVVAKSTNSC